MHILIFSGPSPVVGVVCLTILFDFKLIPPIFICLFVYVFITGLFLTHVRARAHTQFNSYVYSFILLSDYLHSQRRLVLLSLTPAGLFNATCVCIMVSLTAAQTSALKEGPWLVPSHCSFL